MSADARPEHRSRSLDGPIEAGGDAGATQHVLVLGASGYVGGRLVPELVAHGHRVRCLTRSRSSLTGVPWAESVDVVEGDLIDTSSLGGVFDDIDVVVYLVHSLDEDGAFAEAERTAAVTTRNAAERAGASRIVYLSGLGDDEDLSPHLASRHAVGGELAAGQIEVLELRAAVILGAGSASFEMLRHLAEVLPVMLAPTWVQQTDVQPISIADVLTFLIAAVEAPELVESNRHRIIEIGGHDVMTYRDLVDLYCEVVGLPRRRMLTMRIIPLGLSARWVDLVTPLPDSLARRLVESLEHDVVVTNDSARSLSAHDTIGARRAIEMSVAAIDDLDIPTHWSGRSERARASEPRPWDPDWAGGTVLEDHRTATTEAPAEDVMRVVRGIGGRRGWYGFGFLWWLRGLLDQLVGGVGLRRGRRHPDEIEVGEALDFWRVEASNEQLFRLRAEMRLPGIAWLEWSVDTADSTDPADRTERSEVAVHQCARYVPNGLWGRMYWWALWPAHAVIFPLMLRRLLREAEA